MNSISLASIMTFVGILASQPALVNSDPINILYVCNGAEFTHAQAQIQVSYAYTVKQSRQWNSIKTSKNKIYPLKFNQLGYSNSYIFPIHQESSKSMSCYVNYSSPRANASYGCPLYISNYMVVMDEFDNLLGMVWHYNHEYHHCDRIEYEGSDISVASLASDSDYPQDEPF